LAIVALEGGALDELRLNLVDDSLDAFDLGVHRIDYRLAVPSRLGFIGHPRPVRPFVEEQRHPATLAFIWITRSKHPCAGHDSLISNSRSRRSSHDGGDICPREYLDRLDSTDREHHESEGFDLGVAVTAPVPIRDFGVDLNT
jgi:hypothetical protein